MTEPLGERHPDRSAIYAGLFLDRQGHHQRWPSIALHREPVEVYPRQYRLLLPALEQKSDLAFVRQKSPHLDLQGRRDVHRLVGVSGICGEKKFFCHHVRLQPIGQLFRMVKRVWCVIGRLQRGESDGAVVRVILERGKWVEGEQDVRLVLANGVYELLAQPTRRQLVELPIVMLEERDLFHPQDVGSLPRLHAACFSQLGWVQLEGSLVARRGDEHGDLGSFACHLGQRATGKQLGVVGVRAEYEYLVYHRCSFAKYLVSYTDHSVPQAMRDANPNGHTRPLRKLPGRVILMAIRIGFPGKLDSHSEVRLMTKGALTKVDRLRQTNEAWESTIRYMRAWITPKGQKPYRPYIILTVSQTGNKVVGSEVCESKPTPEQVLNTLAKVMRRPTLGGGRKRRPAVIYIDDETLVEALAPHLREVSVRCEYRQTLREIEQALRSMEQFMHKREPLLGLLKSPGVTPFLVNGLFEAADHFYRQAPWQWIDDSHPIEVRYPPDGRPRYAVVMGHGRETYGLAVYNSPDELREIYSGKHPQQLVEEMEWTSLLFCEVMEMPFDDLDDMEKYDWPVAGDLAYPVPIKVSRSGQPFRPGKSELLWLEAALLAVPAFLRDSVQADVGPPHPAEATLTVTVADGEDRVRLIYPVPGFEPPAEAQWADILEEEEAQRAVAEERNDELFGTFEQWLDRQGLAETTVQRHLDNVEFFAGGYMAGDGGFTEVPRPADQAGVADVDEFLGDWFPYEANWPSVGTLKATMAALKKFYVCLKETGQMAAGKADEILEMLQSSRGRYIELMKDFEEDEFGE